MELNEDRRKKLEAGKEKLAAFRKKKAKRKKEPEKSAASKEIIEPLNGGDLSPPQFPSWNDVHSAQEDSNQFFVSSGDDFSSEETESRSSVYYQAKLADARQRISELEETVEGKQHALDSMTKEHELSDPKTSPNVNTLNLDEVDNYNMTHPDLERALAQRDELITQLTQSLQSSTNVPPIGADTLEQMEFLSSQVSLLQNQLQESDQAVQEQTRLRDMSSSALQAAKFQMLQLQTIVNDKDTDLQLLSEQMKMFQDNIERLMAEKLGLVNDLSQKTQELSDLSKKLEDSHKLDDIQGQWEERETALRDELSSKSEEIKSLQESEQERKGVIEKLREDVLGKDEKLQELIEELENLERLKEEMEMESRELMKENKELTAHRQNLSTILSDHNKLTVEFDNMTKSNATLSAEHENLKSKCLLLENVVDELKEENTSSKSQLNDLKKELEEEQQRHAEQEKAWLEMESRQNTYSDQLNNKLNDLQNKLSNSKEAFSTAEETLENEKERVANLESQLSGKAAEHSELHSEIQCRDLQIAELEKLRLKYQNMAENLEGKETDFEKTKEELLGRSSGLEKQLEELKAENEMLTEQTVQLRDDLMSAQHVHGVEMSERDHRENCMEEQMELMNEELNNATKRSKGLESKLMENENNLLAEGGKRKDLQDQLNALEIERDTLRETVQSLNADIGKLKNELIVESKSPVEEKIMAYENQQLNATLKKNENETEEKVQLTILEEEILSLKTKLDERGSASQNLEEKLYKHQSEYSGELEKHKSDILRLQQEFESQSSQNIQLGEELTALKSSLEATKGELTSLEESHKAASQELEGLRDEKLCLQTKKEQVSSRVEELEREAEDLKSTCQELRDREKELLESQEIMEARLEATMEEWQKLQITSQEKEVKLQNLQEILEEEGKKRSSATITLEEELGCIRVEAEQWKEKCEENEEIKCKLQSQLSVMENELDSKIVKLSEAMKTVNEKDTMIKDLEAKLSGIDSEIGSMSEENSKSKREISDLLWKLGKSEEDIQMSQEEMENFKNALDAEKQEKESLLEKMDFNEKQLMNTIQLKEEFEQQMQDLQMQVDSKQSHINVLADKLEDLNVVVANLESRCTDGNDLLCQEQREKSVLSESLKKIKLQGQRLESLLASMTGELDEKEGVLVDQSTALNDSKAEINRLNECVNEKEKAVNALEESNIALIKEKEKLETDNQILSDENTGLSVEHKKLEDKALMNEQDVGQLSLEAKKLQEEIKQARQEIEGKNGRIHDLTHDSDMQNKEISDLKSDIEEKECKIENLATELDDLQTAIDTSEEEKKQLKINFDACMEDMQQKTAEQDAELRRVKCQLAEESRSISQCQSEMKEMFELQLSQLEDKLLSVEREKAKLVKDISETHEKSNLLKESYENQLSELELNLQAANSECVRLNECMIKANTNFENDIADLKSLHELQRSELIDNNLSLEKIIEELQKSLNENMDKAKIERNDLEQSFEVQMLDLDEKRRNSECEVARLKRHLDEMRKDHEKDVQNLEKRYDTQLFELEDKCSIMGSELDRTRKSMMSFEGDFGEERRALELKVEDLENIRRELEIKVSVLDDDLSNLKALSQRREEEMKSILKNAAEKQTNMGSEMGSLRDELSMLKLENKSSLESLQKQYESTVEDLETRNKHLKGKITSLEMHVEEDLALRNQDPTDTNKVKTLNSKILELKEQVGVLSDENLSLKRRLLSHKSSEKKILLSAGVQDICPSHPTESETVAHGLPKLVTSTPSKGFDSEDSFSPTVEEVSLIEGFVAERDQPVFSSLHMQSVDEDRFGEPDFVAEEQDRFQPEMVIEKVIEGSEHGPRQHSMHPIREEAIKDEFQPELNDQFLMETIEEPNSMWPSSDLSAGFSPTMLDKMQFNFTNMPPAATNVIERTTNQELLQAPSSEIADRNSNCKAVEDNLEKHQGEEEPTLTASEMERKLADQRERLEEEYVSKMRNQKRDLVVEYETKKEEYQRESEQHFAQKAQSIKNDWESKFAKALQKLRRDVERRHLKELRHARQGHTPKTNAGHDHEDPKNNSASEDGMPDIAEGSEELDRRVQQLSRENQELAEARDELLKQIEISQAWGLHHRVQHELQTKISGRESPESQPSPTQTLTDQSPTTEESPNASPSHTLTSPSPVQEESFVPPTKVVPSFSATRLDNSVDSVVDNKAADGLKSDTAPSESGSFQTEVSETSSARERFLEEFTDISQQSSQDLPLEWELTTTLADAGEFEPDTHHGSVWEVFDGRCMRQDCQEVRQGSRRLFQFLVKCEIDVDELLSEESGLFLPGVIDNLDDNYEGPIIGFDPAFPNVPNEESLALIGESALSTLLKLEREQIEEEFSVENLKRDLYETLHENENLRIRLARECKVRQELEKKFGDSPCKEDINFVAKQNEPFSLLGISKETVDISIQVDSTDLEHRVEPISVTNKSKCQHCEECQQKVNSLNRVVIDKEQALLKLGAELTDLKSVNRDDSELEMGKLIVLRDEMESLKKEVQFKDRVVNNLREDLNRLIYPNLPPSHNVDSGLLEEVTGEKAQTKIDEQGLDNLELSFVSCNSEENNSSRSNSEFTDSLSNSFNNTGVKVAKSDKEMCFTTSSPNESDMTRQAPVVEGHDAEISAGEGLAFVTQQDIENATKQCEKLTLWEGDGSPVLDGSNLMNFEGLGAGSVDGSVVSSSSSSTLPSQLSTPEFSRRKGISPMLDLQDNVLAEELNKLRKDLHKTRAIYSKESTLLQEALEKDKTAKELVTGWKKEPDFDRSGSEQSDSPTESKAVSDNEVTILRQRLTICLEQNKMLEAENTSLRARIREQDAVVLIVKQKLLEKERCSDEWRLSMNHQLQCLQQQRDDLLQLLKSLEEGKSPNISEVMGDAALKEDSLRRVQENLMDKMEELDHLHQMLTQRQIELQHCEAERRHLEQLCLLKDQTEMQLMKQKRLMEEQVTEIELRLRERETSLVEEKTRLLHELREKDQHVSQMSQSARCSPVPPLAPYTPTARSSSLGDLNTGLLETLISPKHHNAPQMQPSNLSVDDVDKQHMEAIEKLKQKLKLEYDLRAARMAESQASAIASYWQRRGKSS